jgi:hypothetical protein
MSTDTAITRIPENTSLLQTTKFSFVIPTLPFLRYFTQGCAIPGVSTSAVRVDNPFSATWRHGDKLEYDQLTITSLVDEDLRVYEETMNWLIALTFPEKFPQYIRARDKKASPYHDAYLTINTNANLPNIRIKFTECHPLSISAIQFSAADNADVIPTIDIGFRYDLMNIERLPLT